MRQFDTYHLVAPFVAIYRYSISWRSPINSMTTPNLKTFYAGSALYAKDWSILAPLPFYSHFLNRSSAFRSAAYLGNPSRAKVLLSLFIQA